MLHPLIRVTVLASAKRVVVVARERFADEAADAETIAGAADTVLDEHLAELRDSPLDWGAVAIDRSAPAVRYHASAIVSVPIYLTAGATGVAIDWDYARLLAGRRPRMVADIAAAQIAGIPTYGPRTIAAGVHRATAGAMLVASPRGVATDLPPPITLDGPRPITPGADIEGALLGAMTDLLAARPLLPTRTAVELSGGMDSALTALAAARSLGPGLMSVGAQFAGAMGAAQRERRRLLCEHGGFDDLEVPAERLAPFAPMSLRRVRHGVWPEDENYPELFEAMFGVLRASGIEALISGFGGDELYLAYEGEDGTAPAGAPARCPLLTAKGMTAAARAHPPYPQGWLRQSCWQSAASQAQRALRHGLWPIYPYHNTTLARFVSRLPRSYRRDRRLLRTTLTRVIGAPVFEGGYVKENFDAVAQRGITENRDYLLDLVGRSPLMRHPYLRGAAVEAALRGDIAALDRDTFNALFRLLKIVCFFQADAGTAPLDCVR